MITLFLVEDEEDAREGLKKFIPWEAMGIDKIEEAANGLEAVGLCESVCPDILITDVRMPKMDGIQLAFYIRERFPMCRILFVSGYSDKEYLKSAIRIGAVSYIEKPIDIGELKDTLEQTVMQCLQDRKKMKEEENSKANSKESFPLILQRLAAGACFTDNNGVECLRLADNLITDSGPCLIHTLAIKIHEDAALTEYEREFYRDDIISFINGKSSIPEDLRPAACFIDGRSLIVHCFFPGPPDEEARKALLIRFLARLNLRYSGKFVFTAVMGKAAESPLDIPASFRSAQRLVKTLFYCAKGELHLAPDVREEEFALPATANMFDRLMADGLPDKLHAWLDNLETSIAMHPGTDIGYVKNVYFKIYEQISLAARKRNVQELMLVGDVTYFWQELSLMETLHDITLYFHSLADSYFAATGITASSGPAIQEIMEYIRVHYTDLDLSIRKIAEFSHYDYFYLCTLFKRKTKSTINDYIAKVRVEKAIELLKDKRVRLLDITGMVGYSDPSYFTKLFKKHVGSTPSEFREKYYL